MLALTPEPLLNLSQHRLEPILVERLARESRADAPLAPRVAGARARTRTA